MTSAVLQLRERLAGLEDLRVASGLLHWDQQTMMPPTGGPQHAEALGTLEQLSHERFIDAETGRLLHSAAAEVDGAAPESDDACLVRLVRRRWEKATRVPTELAAEMARAGSAGQEAWVAARRDSDFAAFAPYLEHNLELARRYVDCFDDFECPYDALLDDYQPEMKTTDVAALFAALKAELVPLIAKLSQYTMDDSSLHGHFPVESQRKLAQEVVRLMGFDGRGWRMDDTVHPFATSFGSSDVRITTRWDETYLGTGLFGAMHECGHGLYEAGIAPALQRTPLGHGQSLGVHESQSRLWENMVGRGRDFSEVLAPLIATIFGGELANLDPLTLFRAVNRIRPSLIRVEADEATYSLHIILRFELEQELIEGRLAVRDLPEAWNARIEEYLGLTVPDDRRGVLQDVHWSAGLIGYFSTYALGNMIAGQLWWKVRADLPDLSQQISAGRLDGLREWLVENVHRYGSKFTTAELLERAVGGPIETGPFVSYLKGKLSDVYEIPLS